MPHVTGARSRGRGGNLVGVIQWPIVVPAPRPSKRGRNSTTNVSQHRRAAIGATTHSRPARRWVLTRTTDAGASGRIAWGQGVRQGMLTPATVRTMDTAATVLWLLAINEPADWAGRPVADAYAPLVTAVAGGG